LHFGEKGIYLETSQRKGGNVMTREEKVRKLARQAALLTAKKREIEKELKDITSKLMEYMPSEKMEYKFVGFEKPVKFSLVEGMRESIDTKALKEECPDIWQRFRKVSQFKYVKITL
jgi:predicted phage-related endonuclease